MGEVAFGLDGTLLRALGEKLWPRLTRAYVSLAAAPEAEAAAARGDAEAAEAVVGAAEGLEAWAEALGLVEGGWRLRGWAAGWGRAAPALHCAALRRVLGAAARSGRGIQGQGYQPFGHAIRSDPSAFTWLPEHLLNSFKNLDTPNGPHLTFAEPLLGPAVAAAVAAALDSRQRGALAAVRTALLGDLGEDAASREPVTVGQWEPDHACACMCLHAHPCNSRLPWLRRCPLHDSGLMTVGLVVRCSLWWSSSSWAVCKAW